MNQHTSIKETHFYDNDNDLLDFEMLRHLAGFQVVLFLGLFLLFFYFFKENSYYFFGLKLKLMIGFRKTLMAEENGIYSRASGDYPATIHNILVDSFSIILNLGNLSVSA